MSERLAYYMNHWEICSEQVRPLAEAEKKLEYGIAYEKWMRNPLMSPTNEQERVDFFRHCDKMVKSTTTYAQDWYTVMFTCWGAAQIIVDQEMAHMSLEERARAVSAATDISFSECKKREEERVGAPEPSNPYMAALLQDSIFCSSKPKNELQLLAEELIGQLVQYTDSNGTVEELTVVDFGENLSRGQYFSVEYEGKKVMDISVVQMQEILARRLS